jgi:hypothetical protein
VFILGLLVRETEGVVTWLNEAAINTGLVMKESKTKYVQVTRNITNLVLDLIMGVKESELFQNFSCLDDLIMQKV